MSIPFNFVSAVSQVGVVRFLIFLVAFAAGPVIAAGELTLAEAERLALTSGPTLAARRADANAAAERVALDSALPDPQLTLGAINVPTDSLSLSADDMTMTSVGVRQTFPPGATRALSGRRAEDQRARAEATVATEGRALLRRVRETWLDLYFFNRSLTFIEQSRALQKNLLRAAQGRHRALAENERFVLQARQALMRVDDRAETVRAQIASAQAMLAQIIGDAAFAPLPSSLPELPDADIFDSTAHPERRALESAVRVAQWETAIAREKFKPGMMLDVSYGVRQQRPDMVSAMVTLDLPVFRRNGHNGHLAETQARMQAAEFETEAKLRELDAMNHAARAQREALDRRITLYTEQLLPSVQREAHAPIAGYARDETQRREARIKELETMLELERLRVDRAKAQAQLLYLSGERP